MSDERDERDERIGDADHVALRLAFAECRAAQFEARAAELEAERAVELAYAMKARATEAESALKAKLLEVGARHDLGPGGGIDVTSGRIVRAALPAPEEKGSQ